MDLGGRWRAAPADEDLRRRFAAPEFDDSGWEPLAVPGHWRSAAAFAGSDGPVLHRRAFDRPAPDGERRAWLVLDGVFYQGDVWLDGGYVGDTEGYFATDAFEITEQLHQRAEHVLAVEVSCSPQPDRAAKRNLTGIFQDSDDLDPTWNPGGIWRPVRIEETGPIRIRDLRVLCAEATPERAVVVFRANLQTIEPVTALVRSAVGGTDHELTQPLAAGENHVEWRMIIERPELWWPWALGGQPLHEAHVEVALADRPHEVSHRRTCRTGLRQVELVDWRLRVNGEALFLKGARHGPTRQALAEATPEELAGDVRLARESGLDLLRLHAHVTRPELYAAADELGVLLWQDLPLRRGYSRSVRRQAVRQAGAAVRLLGHHPSVALWCGHDEPSAVPGHPARSALRAQVPTFERTVLDGLVARALRAGDGTRPVVARSGDWPHLPRLDGTDAHVSLGWRRGAAGDLVRFVRAAPRLARFVTLDPPRSVPPTDGWLEPDRWPSLDWPRLAERHGYDAPTTERRVPPGDFATYTAWRAATWSLQADTLERQIRELRRRKRRPVEGFVVGGFADAHPALTGAVLDHERQPKPAHAALVRACAPVLLVVDRLPQPLRAGAATALAVHVVNDLRVELAGLRCDVRLTWTGGGHAWRFAGDVAADGVALVGTIQFEVPAAAVGSVLRVEATLTGGALLAGTVPSDLDEALVLA